MSQQSTMSYHGSTSPPAFFDCSPPQSSSNTQNVRGEQHTPKRRRLESGGFAELDLDMSPDLPANEFFDFSFSPPREYVQHPGSSQGSNPPNDFPGFSPPYAAGWGMDLPRWDDCPPIRPPTDAEDFEQRLRDAVLMTEGSNPVPFPPQPSNHPRPPVHPTYRFPEDYGWNLTNPNRGPFNPPSTSPPRHRPQSQITSEQTKAQMQHMQRLQQLSQMQHMQQMQQMQAPSRGPRIPVRLPVSGLIPPPPQTNQAPPRRKASITLSLSRATAASIEELPEHKRECPACQLEFEEDNYLAVISCCGTAMHAVCLSAWVNSQTYSKAKVCMKCRKPIDARRTLNSVVPPVTDKSWDEGVDFNAPATVKDENKVELDISNRASSAYHRYHARRPPGYHRRRAPMITEDDLPAEIRPAFQRLQKEFQKETESVKARYEAVCKDWHIAFEAEAQAAHVAANAKEALHARTGITQREVDGLVERCREAREVQEVRHAAYRHCAREQESLERQHQHRITVLMEDAMITRRRDALAAEAQALSHQQ